MKILIAGAGEVGFHLAKLLANEEHDIVLIDLNQEKLKYAEEHLDVATVRGKSTSYNVLKGAGATNADMLISVTSSEENNILTCIIGKNLGTERTIARVDNVEFLQDDMKLDLLQMGVDELISPEALASKEIKRLLREAAITDNYDFERGQLSLIGITIDAKDPLNNKTLAETTHLNPGLNFITVAILRDNKTIIPRGDTRFQLDDHVYYIAEPEGVEKVLKLTGKKRSKIKNIMILGGSKAGYHAARGLSRQYNVKLLEIDKDKCFHLADQLEETMVINGDGREVELLEEEGIENVDAFIALTGNSETNIISSLVAKNHKVPKTIALVENMSYIHLSQNIGVDTLINKKLIAANFIFRYIREGQVVTITSIHGVDAEILEFVVKEDSKIISAPLKDLEFPKTAIVGGVIRKGKGHITMGDFTFEPNDRVVVLSKPECIHKVEDFFK
ncbi:Trk system potassium transporter TrkA [Flammeovirgaceae bacterium SG7u.111]|nr:Trk system potassium transporter TrkA [Flammeovirgaceae bacterium SG7u.132]WPO35883.1 Trk system potassium transporter TrkA [Flammeovirgaceae bacterium SG7u.111]